MSESLSAKPFNPDCEARQYGKRAHCGRCGYSSARGDVFDCKPAAQCNLTAAVIRAAIEGAADDLDASILSACKVTGGDPDPHQLRRVAALRAGLRFIDQARGKGA